VRRPNRSIVRVAMVGFRITAEAVIKADRFLTLEDGEHFTGSE
jgi:hypothetical protein